MRNCRDQQVPSIKYNYISSVATNNHIGVTNNSLIFDYKSKHGYYELHLKVCWSMNHFVVDNYT